MTKKQINNAIAKLSSKKEYTPSDAMMVKKMYNETFNHLLKKSVKEFVELERRLNNLQIKIQSILGEYINNPCPAQFKGYCEFCTGWYKKKPNRSSREVKHEMCSGTEENKIKCLFFEYSQGSKEAK